MTSEELLANLLRRILNDKKAGYVDVRKNCVLIDGYFDITDEEEVLLRKIMS